MDRFDEKSFIRKETGFFLLKMPVKLNESEKKEENKKYAGRDSVLDKDSVLMVKSVLMMNPIQSWKLKSKTGYKETRIITSIWHKTGNAHQESLKGKNSRNFSVKARKQNHCGQSIWRYGPEAWWSGNRCRRTRKLSFALTAERITGYLKHRNSVYHCYFCRTKLED